jgi:hypothetical protein
MGAGNQTKAAVTVAEMARMVGLSRARFYQLIDAGVFPQPCRSPETGRPFYNEVSQKLCLEVRRRNCGVNGEPILFYARRVPTETPNARKRKPIQSDGQHSEILESVKALGLASVTLADVQTIVTELFPNGSDSRDRGEVSRAVFLQLKRQNSTDNVR